MDQAPDRQTDLAPHNEQEETAESRGGDHREIQDNGTQDAHFSVGGQRSVSTVTGEQPAQDLPNTINDYGTTPGEVSHSGNFQNNYGLEGPAAGGKLERNTIT